MKIAKLIFALMLIVCAFNARAEESYDGIPAGFISKIEANDFEGAFDTLSRSFNDSDTEQFKGSFISAAKSWGKYSYSELYSTEAIGTRLVRLTYIIGMTQRPLLLNLTLYKADQRWDVRSFNITSKMDEIVKQTIDAH